MFRIHEAAAQEERQRKRTAQIEKDRKRKEQLKEKEAKENDSRRKRVQAEKVKEETARRELRSYIQVMKTISTWCFRISRSCFFFPVQVHESRHKNEMRKTFLAADTNYLFYFMCFMNIESEIVQVGSIGKTARKDRGPVVERLIRNCAGE